MIAVAFFESKHEPNGGWIWAAAVPAFILETLFYIGSGFEQLRALFIGRARPSALIAAALWASALLPYLVFSIGSGTFLLNAFALLALLTGVLAFWHAVLPRRLAFDAGFLVIAAVPFLMKVFPRLYRTPDPHLRMDALGHLMWIRIGLLALLMLREWNPGPVSFWPKLQEWRIGIIWFLITAAPLIAVALMVGDVRFGHAEPWWRICLLGLGWFLAGLWVIGFAEELFFRGVIERALLSVRMPAAIAIGIAAVLFAAAHLGYRGFPDYRRAASTFVLGIGCGAAYWRSATIRGSMVTHACAIAMWKMFFK